MEENGIKEQILGNKDLLENSDINDENKKSQEAKNQKSKATKPHVLKLTLPMINRSNGKNNAFTKSNLNNTEYPQKRTFSDFRKKNKFQMAKPVKIIRNANNMENQGRNRVLLQKYKVKTTATKESSSTNSFFPLRAFEVNVFVIS